MSVIVILTLKSKPDSYDQLGSMLKEILSDTASFDGCKGLYACGNHNSQTFLLYEEWESVEHQQKYLDWRQQRGDLEALGEMLREPPLFETRDFIFSS